MYGCHGDDRLYGQGENDVLDGGAGDDHLYGDDDGNWVTDDTLVFAGGSGQDKIYNFVAGGQTEDVMDLSNHSSANGFGDIVATQVGSDTLFDLGVDSITLLGVSAGDLHADDFIF